MKNSRILTYGYNAMVTAVLGKTSSDRILQHAHTLVAQLVADREVSLTHRMRLIVVPHTEYIVGKCHTTAYYLHLPLAWWNCCETGRTNAGGVYRKPETDFFAGTRVFRKPRQQVHPACAFDLCLDFWYPVSGNTT
jgi:hypothetical protein